MKMKSTKKTLIMSVLSLLLCCSMLIGTTFAWFTDSVESGSNIIKSGTLDVEMYWADGTKAIPADDSADWANAADGAIFNYDKWEPGYTEVRHIKIANEGTLALKYQILIKANGVVSKLSDVIDVYYCDPAQQIENRSDLPADKRMGTLTEALAGMSTTASGSLEAGKDVTITLALKMQEEAGNEYQGLSIGTDFSIILLATQYTSEDDSFNDQYDVNSKYDYYEGSATPAVGGTYVEARNEEGTKIASANVPDAAVNDPKAPIDLIVIPVEKDGSVTVNADQTAESFEVKVTNLVPGNTTPIDVTLRIPAGLDPATVSLYHKNTKIDCLYDPNTGIVSFKTTNFSPFTVVYDAESEYVAPEVPEVENKLSANVSYAADSVNKTLLWGNFGGVSPDYNVDPDPKLEAAFQFTCPDYENASDELKALIDAYRYWYCDFFVSLDANLGENQIFLGGNYGAFGWIGFHNGALTLSANTELPLLCSVTTNPWTYEAIEQNVGSFLCGVGDVNNALEGKTFTVKLRLINPEKVDTTQDEWWANLAEDAYIDANVVTYQFGGNSIIDGVVVVPGN